MQNFGGDRVEKSLGQFRLVVVHQQTNVVQLDLLPHIHALLVGFEFFFKARRALFHAQIVELYAIALRALLAMPVARFKAVFGAR